MIEIKSKRENELMKEACRIAALTHKAIEEAIKPRNIYIRIRYDCRKYN